MNESPDFETLVADLSHEKWFVRTRAIQQLSALEGPRVTALLVQVLQQDPDRHVRESAATALGQLQDPQALAPLVRALQDAHQFVRKRAAEALDALHWEPPTEEEEVYYLIAQGMWGELEEAGPAALEPLLHRLADTDEYIRKEAAQVLGTLQGPEVIERLVQVLHTGDVYTQEEAIRALDRQGKPQVIPALIQALAADYSNVSDPAIAALADLPGTLPHLLQALKDPTPSIRRGAAEALGLRADPQAVKPLGQALQDPDLWVRRRAAEALGRIGSPDAVDDLQHALQDPEVYEAAREALLNIRKKWMGPRHSWD